MTGIRCVVRLGRDHGELVAIVCTSTVEEAHRLLREKQMQFFGGPLDTPARPGVVGGNVNRTVGIQLLP